MTEIPVALIAIFSFPAVVFFSLLFEGIDRKLHARMQNRIGPPIIQPFYDILKLFSKERIIPATADYGIFTIAPVAAAACSIIGAAIPFISIVSGEPFMGDLIIVLYLLAATSVMVMVGGSSSGNPYGAIGFSRMMTMIIAYEIPLFFSVILTALKSGSALTSYDIALAQIKMGSCMALAYPSMALAAATFLLCIPAAAEAAPFDIPGAKTEIVYGCLIEYTGPYLALLKLAKATLTFSLVFLATTLFFYAPAVLNLSETWLIVGLCLLFSLIIMICVVTFPRTIFARLKIGEALRFYWSIPPVLVTLSVSFYLMGL